MSTLPSSGSIVVKKVDGNNNFIEDVLDSTDLMPLISGDIVFTSGTQTISGNKTFTDQTIFLTSGLSLAANSPMVLIRGSENFTRFGIEGTTPVFQGWKFNGTVASKTIVTSGNNLALFQGGGWNGSDFAPVTGRMSVRADLDWGSGTSYPTRLDFETTASGATAPTTRWRMDRDGHFYPLTSGTLNVGSASTPLANLYVDNLVFPGGGNFVTTTGGAQTISGTKTFVSAAIMPTLTLTGSIATIFSDTADNSDNKMIIIAPANGLGSNGSRSAGLALHGNELSSNPGNAILAAGNVSTSVVSLETYGNQAIQLVTSGTRRAYVDGRGALFITTTGNTLTAGEGVIQVRGDENNTRITIEGTTSVFQAGSYGGTLTSKSAVTNNTTLGILQFGGFDGTTQLFSSGRLSAIVDGSTWTSGSKPTKLMFSTTPSGSPTLRTVWEMKQDGSFIPGSGNAFNFGATDLHIANAFINNIFNDISSNALDLTSRSGGGITFNTDAGSAITTRWMMDASSNDFISNGTAVIRTNTSDGSDNATMSIYGGGGAGTTRGASLTLNGNEAGSPGSVQLLAGNVSGSFVRIGSAGGHSIQFYVSGNEIARFHTGNEFLVGQTSPNGAGVHAIKRNVAEGNQILYINGSTDGCIQFFNVDNISYNSNAAGIRVGRDTPTSRSINAAGTVNANGADYAEYMFKAVDCGTVEKGDVVGISISGTLTDKWSQAISFAVKSTNPAYVGADEWGTEEYLEANNLTLEEARSQVDRIAFAGRAPINLDSAYSVGDYIVAQSGVDDSISAIAISKEDKHLYAGFVVGRVWATYSGSQPYCNILFD